MLLRMRLVYRSELSSNMSDDDYLASEEIDDILEIDNEFGHLPSFDIDDELLSEVIDAFIASEEMASDHHPSVDGGSNSENQMTPKRLQKHLQDHPKARKKHTKKEKELRDIVLRAAEGGYVDIMRQALPMLNEVQKRLKQKPELKSVLNFCEGKGEGSPPQNKQVCWSRVLFLRNPPLVLYVSQLHPNYQ